MTIRFRMMTAGIAVIVVVNSLLALVALQVLAHLWLDEVQKRVRKSLNSARVSYRNQITTIAAFLQGAALDRGLVRAAEQPDGAELESWLRQIHRIGAMDFLVALDPQGRVRCRGQAGGQRGNNLIMNPLVTQALRKKEPAGGTLILTEKELREEGEDLAARARFDLIPTPAARPTEETVRTDGMVVAAAVPVLDPGGRVALVLYGGNLLNRRYEMVDAIKKEVFANGLDKDETGTVTIFQGDLRISTNVIREDGSRAVGTRLSGPVAETVLERGGNWEAPAFVVNDWYITSYEPIRDPEGQIVGVLYVGLLQAPFVHQKRVITGVFLALVGVATLFSFGLLFFLTSWVLSPIRQIVAMSAKVIAGDLKARVAIRPSGEMGMLCQAINRMADALAEREEKLKIATRQQIGRSEQLASVGRLAAGVAHEINNPLTGVLTYACMLRDKKNMDPQDREDLNVIIHETTRVARIVRGLLDFARERPVRKAPMDLNEVVRHTILLLGNQEAFQNIVVVDDLADHLPRVNGDSNQLEQVLLNLALNACEAMPQGGTLALATSAEDGKVVVRVTDTGHGIKPDHLDQIFEPFFTTKPVGKGTGLGLSVSYGIVRQHNGSLEVESEEGKGSTFTVTLPSLVNENST